MKKLRLCSILLTFAVTVLAACSPGATGTQNAQDNGSKDAGTDSTVGQIEPITLRTATAWPENDIQSKGYPLFAEKVKELSGGAITLEYKGGPEAIPPFDQGEAVRNGVLDISYLSAAYYTTHLPEAAALDYSELTPSEERENGALEYLNEIHHEKLGVHILGRGSGQKYSMYTKVPVDSIEDLKGLRFRVSPVYVPFIQALGGEVLSMPGGEIYQALEKGVIDGFTWPEAGITDMGFEGQVKYKILPTYWQIDAIGIVNYEKWQSFSPEVQDILNQAFRYVEEELPKVMGEYIANEEKILEEQGVQFVQLPEEEFLKIANDAGWGWIREKSPEHGEKLEELFRK